MCIHVRAPGKAGIARIALTSPSANVARPAAAPMWRTTRWHEGCLLVETDLHDPRTFAAKCSPAVNHDDQSGKVTSVLKAGGTHGPLRSPLRLAEPACCFSR